MDMDGRRIDKILAVSGGRRAIISGVAAKCWLPQFASPFVIAITVLCWFHAAMAQTDQDWADCAGSGGNEVDLSIRGCSGVIEAGVRIIEKVAAAYNNRGIAYRYRGDLDRAIRDYDQAIHLKPDYASAYNNRGVAYINKGDADHGIADYDRAIQIRPDYLAAFYNRALALNQKGSFERAVADYTVLINADPGNSALLYRRGMAKLKNGDTAGGTADIQSAQSIMPNVAEEIAGQPR